jgi:DNA repair protein RadC
VSSPEPFVSTILGPLYAREVAAAYPTARSLAQASADELCSRVPSLGTERAEILRAAFDLGVLLATETARPEKFRAPAEVAAYLMPRYCAKPVETFGALYLDIRHGLLRELEISTGNLTTCVVHAREVFKPALDARAAALVVFHNHPSGDPEPSAEDLTLTRRLAAAGSLLGIELLDHLVLGAGRYVSLKDRGTL